jgi:hypothetical protein
MLLLLLLLLSGVFIATHGEDNQLSTIGSNASSIPLVSVSCPSTITEFTALTEMVLEGRNDFLTEEEGNALRVKFPNIYNDLTTSNCDSYFRRLSNITMVNATNYLGEMRAHEESGMRKLQVSNVNASSPRNAGISMVYEVAGTCRDCPITQTGAFELYDDSLRRNLKETLVGQWRLLEITSFTTRAAQEVGQDYSDCICAEGTSPEQPKAPGVQQCVDAMNVAFTEFRMELGLFENLNMSDLIQLDDLSGSFTQVNSTLTPDTNSIERRDDNNTTNDNEGATFEATSTVLTLTGDSGGSTTVQSPLSLLLVLTSSVVWVFS